MLPVPNYRRPQKYQGKPPPHLAKEAVNLEGLQAARDAGVKRKRAQALDDVPVSIRVNLARSASATDAPAPAPVPPGQPEEDSEAGADARVDAHAGDELGEDEESEASNSDLETSD